MMIMSEYVQSFGILGWSSMLSALILTERIVPAILFGGLSIFSFCLYSYFIP